MEITLKKNGWHSKLQRFVFKNPPTFYNFCPYFWLTIFCFIVTFIFPIVPFIKLLCLIGRGIMYCLEGIANAYERFICLPFWENISKNMPEMDILKSWYVNTELNWYGGDLSEEEQEQFSYWSQQGFTTTTYKKREAFRKKFDLWKKANPDWEIKLAKIKETQRLNREEHLKALAAQRVKMIEEEVRKEKQKENAKKRNQQTISAIVKYTKWLAYALVACVIALAIFGVYHLGLLIYEGIQWGIAHFHYGRFIAIMQFLGFIFGCVLVIFLIVKVGIKCSNKFTLSFKESWVGKILISCGLGLWWVITKFKFLGLGIGSGCSFLWTYIMTVKKDYCPGINWVEEERK